jgi:hypothetical protein
LIPNTPTSVRPLKGGGSKYFAVFALPIDKYRKKGGVGARENSNNLPYQKDSLG